MLSTIEKKLQDDIERTNNNNNQATVNYHAGHETVVRRWDNKHIVKVCKRCECSFHLIESDAKVKEEQADYTHRTSHLEPYKILR